ncbi:ATP-binding protein [Bradyrhizobium sp. TZ2]
MTPQSLFESFNARSLEPEQVGRGFIFSPAFVDVAARSNSVVLGPRGSGKTTLLKMLTLPALKNWWKRDKNAEIQRLMAELDFVSIYVPSDFTWYPDFRRPIKTQPPKDTDDLLSYSLFRSHVLLAICDTIAHMGDPALADDRYLSKFWISRDEVLADNASKLLARGWGLSLEVGGYFGLRSAVTARIRSIQHLLTVTAMRPLEASSLIADYPYLSATFFDDLREFGNVFEHVYGRKQKWAACFDELEIAPDPVKTPIWQSGRSFDPRFLIKISASPYDEGLTELLQPQMPMVAHDFREIDLSSQPRREIDRFSRRMFTKLCNEVGISPIRAELLLGPSFYDDDFDPEVDGPSVDHGTTLQGSVRRGQGGGSRQRDSTTGNFRGLPIRIRASCVIS